MKINRPVLNCSICYSEVNTELEEVEDEIINQHEKTLSTYECDNDNCDI